MTLKKTAGLSAISLSLLAGGFICSQPVFAVDDAELAKQTQNPIASLISVPIKVDWDTDIGSADADRTTFVVQPVIPISLNEDWNVISRTIVPVYIDAESPVDGGQNYKGNGDVLQSFFFSPRS